MNDNQNKKEKELNCKINKPKNDSNFILQCPFCFQWMTKKNSPIDVHGHLQCPFCKNIFDPCCSGNNF
jgi:hypothetical protein